MKSNSPTQFYNLSPTQTTPYFDVTHHHPLDPQLISTFLYSKIKRLQSSNPFYFLFLSLSGDIELNPGPIKHPCAVCLKSVAKNHRSVDCDECKLWVHIHCGGISPSKYKHLKELDDFNFTCPRCLMEELPSCDIDSDFTEPDDEPIPLTTNKTDFDKISSSKGLVIVMLMKAFFFHDI